jgi:hypothetical protein
MATITKIGAVVTTLGAIVALVVGVKSLMPSDPPGPVGEIRKLDLNSVAGLSEANRKVPDATTCPGVEKERHFEVRRPARPVAVASLELPSVVAQESTDSPTQEDPGSGEDPATPTTDSESAPPAAETDGGTEGEQGEGGEQGDGNPARPKIAAGDPRRVTALRDETGVGEPRIEQLMFNPSGTQVGEITKAQLAGIIANTRKDGSSRNAEPLGWLIDVSTRLENLKGKCAYVQWSLYDAKRIRRVRYPWVRDRRGVRFVARATPDSRRSTFWVPAPIERRRYKVRVALYDANATNLDSGEIPLPK